MYIYDYISRWNQKVQSCVENVIHVTSFWKNAMMNKYSILDDISYDGSAIFRHSICFHYVCDIWCHILPKMRWMMKKRQILTIYGSINTFLFRYKGKYPVHVTHWIIIIFISKLDFNTLSHYVVVVDVKKGILQFKSFASAISKKKSLSSLALVVLCRIRSRRLLRPSSADLSSEQVTLDAKNVDNFEKDGTPLCMF